MDRATKVSHRSGEAEPDIGANFEFLLVDFEIYFFSFSLFKQKTKLSLTHFELKRKINDYGVVFFN